MINYTSVTGISSGVIKDALFAKRYKEEKITVNKSKELFDCDGEKFM